ncbi:MAG: methylated-DNA--[protein]-cysteine S-methyltransferase [Burkholderiaceae bacterium]|nr:methylated-DNA--[protein]-cysteine S-methyltransferase [Burkholderiaceae bacterium]
MNTARSSERTFYCNFRSWLGEVLLTSDGHALTGLYFAGQKDYPAIAAHWQADDDASPFPELREQWREYEAGRLRRFELALAPRGTPFQVRVWRALGTIACGETISYRELAQRAGCPTAIRAVGTAVGRNPLSVVIPCHRVIASDGTLAGYAGGLDRKRALLRHEGCEL